MDTAGVHWAVDVFNNAKKYPKEKEWNIFQVQRVKIIDDHSVISLGHICFQISSFDSHNSNLGSLRNWRWLLGWRGTETWQRHKAEPNHTLSCLEKAWDEEEKSGFNYKSTQSFPYYKGTDLVIKVNLILSPVLVSYRYRNTLPQI